MQQTEAQTMGTTEEKIIAYKDSMLQGIRQYCIDHDLKDKDLYTIDQSRWNSVLLFLYSYTFKPTTDEKKKHRYNENSNIDYSDKELLNNICDIYINLCYEYSKEVSIMGFSKLTGINVETIYNWAKDPGAERGSFEVAKKLNAEREESLSVRLVSGKGNPVGILGILNRHYGWNMGQPRGQDSRQKAPDLPGLERKYLELQTEKGKKPELPKPEF